MAGVLHVQILPVSVENMMQLMEEGGMEGQPHSLGREAGPCRVSVGKIQLEVTTGPSHGDTIPDAQHRPSTTHWLCAHKLILRDLLILPLSDLGEKSPFMELRGWQGSRVSTVSRALLVLPYSSQRLIKWPGKVHDLPRPLGI